MEHFKDLQSGIRLAESAADEAGTIAKYTRLMAIEMEENAESKEAILQNYAEIIGDELNHMFLFAMQFAQTTGIKIAPDGIAEHEVGIFKEE